MFIWCLFIILWKKYSTSSFVQWYNLRVSELVTLPLTSHPLSCFQDNFHTLLSGQVFLLPLFDVIYRFCSILVRETDAESCYKRSSLLPRLNLESPWRQLIVIKLEVVAVSAPEASQHFVSVYNRMRTSPQERTKCLLNKKTRWVCCQHTQIISSIDECRPAFHKKSAPSHHPLLHKTSQTPWSQWGSTSLKYLLNNKIKCCISKHTF